MREIGKYRDKKKIDPKTSVEIEVIILREE